MDRLVEMARTGEDDPDFGRIPSGRSFEERRAGRAAGSTAGLRRSPEVAADNPVLPPPFFGSRVVRGISLDEVAAYLNETALFRNQWQYRPVDGESDAGSRSGSGPSCATGWRVPRPTTCSCPRWCTATSRPTATATT
jgi:5-methyltetrahydrofolate--homocysteine methyltransferase